MNGVATAVKPDQAKTVCEIISISVLGTSFVYGGLRYLSLLSRNIWACEGPALESMVGKQSTLVLFSDVFLTFFIFESFV